MTVYSVQLMFEAETMDAAKRVVADWSVTAGTTLVTIAAAEAGIETPVTITRHGRIGDAVLMHAQRSYLQQPPPPALPPMPKEFIPPQPPPYEGAPA